MEILTTERLIIKSFTDYDVELLYRLHSNPEVAKSTIDGVQDFATVKMHLNDFILHQERHGFAQWAVYLKNSQEFIGRAGFTIRQLDPEFGEQAEMRFAFLPEFWGCGYATEIAHVLVKYAFNILKLNMIAAAHGNANYKSEKILTHAGFEFAKYIYPKNYALTQPIKYYTLNKSSLVT